MFAEETGGRCPSIFNNFDEQFTIFVLIFFFPGNPVRTEVESTKFMNVRLVFIAVDSEQISNQ